MKCEFTQISHVGVHHFKPFNRIKSTQDEKAYFIKRNGLKLNQVQLLSFRSKYFELSGIHLFFPILQ